MAISLGQFRERVQGVQEKIQQTGQVSEQDKIDIRGLLADIRNIRVNGTRTDFQARATLEGRVIELADLAGVDPISGIEDQVVRGSAAARTQGICGQVMGHLKRNASTYGALAALGTFGVGWAYFGVQGVLDCSYWYRRWCYTNAKRGESCTIRPLSTT